MAHTMAQTVADQMVGVPAAAGVKRVYGVVGDSLNGFTDAIRRRGGIEWLHVRHEEVAAFAAGADAHVTGGKLRPRQLAPLQRPVRLPAHASSGGGDRGRKFRRPRSARTISRRRIPIASSRNAPAIASSCRVPSRCRACSRSRCAGRSWSARQRRGRSRRRSAETRRSGAFAEAGRTGAGCAQDRAVGPVARRARLTSRLG
jgi:hypothetical protein